MLFTIYYIFSDLSIRRIYWTTPMPPMFVLTCTNWNNSSTFASTLFTNLYIIIATSIFSSATYFHIIIFCFHLWPGTWLNLDKTLWWCLLKEIILRSSKSHSNSDLFLHILHASLKYYNFNYILLYCLLVMFAVS